MRQAERGIRKTQTYAEAKSKQWGVRGSRSKKSERAKKLQGSKLEFRGCVADRWAWETTPIDGFGLASAMVDGSIPRTNDPPFLHIYAPTLPDRQRPADVVLPSHSLSARCKPMT
eukprot:GHVU01099836.1.p2 GENE.GHVU01099836.1~~GHVU01099836.1.p2  ORF type:complete len:115 (-),score=8.61 GHVU01099836.1:456-800(-)